MQRKTPRKHIAPDNPLILTVTALITFPLIFIVQNCKTSTDKAEDVLSAQSSSFDLCDAPEPENEPQKSESADSEENIESVANAPGLISLGEFTLTAYCPCMECCGEWSENHPSRIGTNYIQRTASGTIPEEGRTIGVDPDVIPFGTRVIINGHEYIAEDSGGAITENAIDIYFDNHEDAINFGRQTAEVFIKNNTLDF